MGVLTRLINGPSLTAKSTYTHKLVVEDSFNRHFYIEEEKDKDE